jgi:UDP-N-acetyl-D-mannosaminuronic acid dehydrogenase
VSSNVESPRLHGAAGDGLDGFENGAFPVAVYGLGHIGLPVAAVFADLTGDAVGIDVSESVVETVSAGRSHLGAEPGLDDLLAETVGDGRLRASTDPAAGHDAALYVVAVPTGLGDDREVDLSAVEAAARAIGEGLSPGDLVCVESTLPPGTCRDLVTPVLAETSGLDPGEFGVAACPERVSSGRALADIREAYPRVVGGVDTASTRAAAAVYDRVTSAGTIPMADAAAAETVKLFEGVYRDVNIALANQLALFADDLGVDVRAAIDAANTQPFCDLHRPGPGVGGHCIPQYPWFLAGAVEADAPLLRTARELNEGMPAHTVDLLADGFAAADRSLDGATVLVLGAAFRAGVADTRASPTHPVVAGVREAGATPLVCDPLVAEVGGLSAFDAEPVALAEVTDREVDGVVLVTDHDAFDGIDWRAFDRPLVVVDGRDALEIDDPRHRVAVLGGGRGV